MDQRIARALGLGTVVGAVGAFFLDRRQGKRRRRTLVDRSGGLVRRTGHRAGRLGRGVAAQTYGLKQKATHLREQPKEYDDVTLTRKVETELFRAVAEPGGERRRGGRVPGAGAKLRRLHDTNDASAGWAPPEVHEQRVGVAGRLRTTR